MIKAHVILLLSVLLFASCKEKDFVVSSPDSRLTIQINTEDSISYKVLFKGKEIIAPSVIGLQLQDKNLAVNAKIKKVVSRSADEKITPLYGKFKELSDKYNETRIDFEGNYSLVIRAYNDGVAYRFVTEMDSDIIVRNEVMNVNITDDPAVIFAETANYTAWELMYMDYASASAILDGKKAITPVLYSMPDGTKVVVTESDVRDYPGMYLVKNNKGFNSNFAQYPDSTALGSWGFVSVVQKTRDYIAKTEGKREFPWRVIIVTDDDKELLTNEIIYKLAKPQILTDVDWIKPGKAAWEWWHDAMLPNADIPSGMDNRNTALYKHYIDFAAENGLEYLMIDAGWSHIFDLSQTNPKVDVQEVISYGKSKNVGVFLWCVAMALTDHADEYLEMMHNWGAVGIKVDFFDRDDQLAMEWYETIAKKAAEHKLMVNFHGCSKPTGLQRMYPNIVNFEAVRGAECSKWDLTANPQHHVTFPFIRMLGGSLDYTPGAMRNKSPQMFKPIDPGLPSAQGTRCHELSMFVIYDQYLAMLCDSPSEYRKYPDIMKFLSKVPTTFDDTKVLAAKVGQYALIAKQKGNEWYVGGMTNWTARDVVVDFSFLTEGVQYTAEIYKDGTDANLYADRYIYETKNVDNTTRMTIPLAAGGGTAMRIYAK
ncbi:alpha-glucosidase [Dysgonomonas alginatilytica]|uniref:Alpha-glucosidase n=1 Tax=Dysgonomonas alginatilytica TaxID=1605892 RepID=A0A2V3PS82_9BACT|nr:glycoside hydrolase family 97 protein [Dysgonomonas alginatilytica]PXV65027.1 alpha-glucosidase [Dysgonomonas alginatilytica]